MVQHHMEHYKMLSKCVILWCSTCNVESKTAVRVTCRRNRTK